MPANVLNTVPRLIVLCSCLKDFSWLPITKDEVQTLSTLLVVSFPELATPNFISGLFSYICFFPVTLNFSPIYAFLSLYLLFTPFGMSSLPLQFSKFLLIFLRPSSNVIPNAQRLPDLSESLKHLFS